MNDVVSSKGRNPWLVYVFILLTAITFAIGQFKVPPVMTLAMEDLGIGLTQGGLLMSIVAITAIVLALFGGLLTVRYKPKTLGIVALFCAILGNIVGLVAPTFEVLLVARLFEGLGYGMQTTVMPTLISEVFPANRRSVPMALYSIWVSIGMLFIYNYANVLTENGFLWVEGWRSCWLFCTVLFIVIAILFILIVKAPKESAFGSEGSTWAEQRRAMATEAKNSSVWFLTLVFAVFGLGCSGYTTFAPTFCQQVLGMDLATANSDTSFLTVGMLAGGFIMTAVVGAYKRERSVLLLICTVITGIFFAVSFMLTDASQVIPFCIIFGIVLQMIPPVTFAVAPQAAMMPQTVGMAIGIATAGDHLGSFIGTVSIGAIVEAAGNDWFAAVPAMAAYALLGLIGAVGFVIAMKKHGKTTIAPEKQQSAEA